MSDQQGQVPEQNFTDQTAESAAASAQQSAQDAAANAISANDAANNAEQAPDKSQEDTRIQKLNRESAKYRTERNQLQEQLQQIQQEREAESARWDKIKAALGIGDDGEESPEEKLKAVQATADEKATEAQRIASEYRDYKVRNEVSAAARKAGADGDLVADLLAGRGALTKLDPDADDYSSQVEQLVTETITQHPTLATKRVPSTSGNAPTPTKTGNDPLDADDLKRMEAAGQHAEINKAFAEGRFKF